MYTYSNLSTLICTRPHPWFEIFDTVIVPTATYASENLGHKVHNSMENVQLNFCRQLLSVDSHAPNVAALEECGKFPLFIICYKKFDKYWLKL